MKDWRTSSRSQANGNCVEVKIGDHVQVRDTKDRDGGELRFTREAWTSFVAWMKHNA